MTEYCAIIAMCGLPDILGAAAAGLLLDKTDRGYAILFDYTNLNNNRNIILTSLGAILIGNAICWFACLQTSYFIFLIGCFFFGMGAQGYVVTANALEAYWFKDKETAVALSIDSSVSFLCVAIVSSTMPVLYNATGTLAWPFAVSVFLTLLSLAAGYGLSLLDKLADIYIPEKVEESSGCNAIKKLGYGFVLLMITYSCRTVGFTIFEFISSEYFQVRFGFTSEEAGIIIAIPYICYALLAVPCGLFVYWIGCKPLISNVLMW